MDDWTSNFPHCQIILEKKKNKTQKTQENSFFIYLSNVNVIPYSLPQGMENEAIQMNVHKSPGWI